MIDDHDGSDSILRLLVNQALKHWSDDALLKLLFEDDYIVRTAVAKELQLRGGDNIYEYVKNRVNDGCVYVREISAFILGQLGTPTMPYKEGSFPLLLKFLSDIDSDVRSSAAAALGHLSYDSMPEDIENALISLSSDCSSDVRSCVAYALGNSSGGNEVIKALTSLRHDEVEAVRSYADLGLDILNVNEKK